NPKASKLFSWLLLTAHIVFEKTVFTRRRNGKFRLQSGTLATDFSACQAVRTDGCVRCGRELGLLVVDRRTSCYSIPFVDYVRRHARRRARACGRTGAPLVAVRPRGQPNAERSCLLGHTLSAPQAVSGCGKGRPGRRAVCEVVYRDGKNDAHVRPAALVLGLA